MTSDTVVRTGISGLDLILMGGIPRTNVILVEGTTGSGKTLLGVEFIYLGITQRGRTAMAIRASQFGNVLMASDGSCTGVHA